MPVLPPQYPPPGWPYTYERGEGRWKHCWNQPRAGFVPGHRGPVGKCPNSLNDSIAQGLLSTGLAVLPDQDDPPDDPHPREIFNVHQGLVYVAVPTRPGVSYHGYPYQGNLPRWICEELTARANADGFAKEFKKWRKQYIPKP